MWVESERDDRNVSGQICSAKRSSVIWQSIAAKGCVGTAETWQNACQLGDVRAWATGKGYSTEMPSKQTQCAKDGLHEIS